MTRAPMTVFLCDTLEAPPRLGYQLHLTSLARAVSGVMPARALVWAEPEANGAAAPWLAALPTAEAPRGRVARKRRYAREAVRWIESEAPPGSALWVRGYTTALLLVPYLRSRSRKERGHVAVYDASSFESLEVGEGASSLAGRVRGFLEERLWRSFDLVRTLSGPMRDFLIAKGVPAERVVVLPVGAEARAERWSPRATAARVLYLGGGADYQGLDALLAAMRLLEREAPEVRLTVVGPEAVAGAPANVEFAGRVPHDRVASFYLSHDLFVLPRPRTPLTELVVPMKLPEAMAFGIPILATDLGAARWAVGEDGALLVADNRPETLAAGIRTALGDPRRLAAWSERGRTRSAAFTWDAIARSVVRELFANGRAGT